MAETYPNCPDCGKEALCPHCRERATYQTPFDKFFWCAQAHWWRCSCYTGSKDVPVNPIGTNVDSGAHGGAKPKTSDLLYAVVTCEARRAHADAQRSTWTKDVTTADVRFFLARQNREPLADEVFLDVDDGYDGLAAKVREVCRWTVARGYTRMLKLDDDVVLFPGRVINPLAADYAGWKQEPAFYNYCSGLAYWLSRKAMMVLACAELTAETAEDRWVGTTLHNAGIRAESCLKIQWFGKISSRKDLPGNTRARLSSCWVAGEFAPHELKHVYVW